MIKNRVKIHDADNLEIIQYYRPRGESHLGKYEIIYYLFIDKGLRYNAKHVSNKAYYDMSHSMVRLKASSAIYKDLRKYLENRATLLEDAFNRDNDDEIKSVLSYTFIAIYGLLNNRASKLSVMDYVYIFHKIGFFENLMKDDPTFREFQEYFYFVFKNSLVSRIKTIEKNSREFEKLFTVYKSAEKKTSECGFVQEDIDKNNHDYIVQNVSYLKKKVWSAMHLNVETRESRALYLHLLFGIAAGVSMIFATVIAFYFQARYGSLSWPFFGAAVLAYMGKDRIKEVLKAVLAKWFFKNQFDYTRKIYSVSGKVLGRFKEKFHFIRYLALPKQARKLLREEMPGIAPFNSNFYNVSQYRKCITINFNRLKGLYSKDEMGGIRDTTRINLSNVLLNMADFSMAIERIHQQEVQKISSVRNYVFTLIIETKTNGNSLFERFGIIANKTGLKRVVRFNRDEDEK